MIFVVYFLISGSAGYVLPRFNNTIYIKIEEGDHFGFSEILLDEDGGLSGGEENSSSYKRSLKSMDFIRRFNI